MKESDEVTIIWIENCENREIVIINSLFLDTVLCEDVNANDDPENTKTGEKFILKIHTRR